MIKLFTAPDLSEISFLQGVLASHKIETEVRNVVTPIYGSLTDAWPELWLADDDDFEQASLLIKDTRLVPLEPAPAWKCPKCGEEFDSCWSCGSTRPGYE